MRILAWDTATSVTAVALLDTDTGRSVALRDDPAAGARPAHVSKLLPLCVEALSQGGIGWGDLDLLAVGLGPGTFTGLRIGIATAHALAQSSGLPLVGVSTLASLAGATARSANVLAVVDARRGEAFVGSQTLAPTVTGPEQLAGYVGESTLAVGDGAVKFRDQLEAGGAEVPGDDSPLHQVQALQHCLIAAQIPVPGSYNDVQPLYLRVPDAELARTRP